MSGDKMVIEKWRFWKQETKEKTEVPNEAAKIALKRASYKDEIRRVSSHNIMVSNLSLEKIHENKGWRPDPEMVKQLNVCSVCQATFSTGQIVWKEVTGTGEKPYWGKRAEKIVLFFYECLKQCFFQLYNPKNYIVYGGRSATPNTHAYQPVKLKMDHPGIVEKSAFM